MVGFPCGAGFRGAFVGGKGMVPEAIEVGAQGLDTGRVQLVQAPVALRSVDDQVGMLQDAQVLRDGRTADRKPSRQFTDRLGTGEQALEDCSSGRIAERVQLLSMSVSNH